MEFRAAVAAFLEERLGQGVVGVRVVGRVGDRVDDDDGAGDEAERGDQRQGDQRPPPVAGGQRYGANCGRRSRAPVRLLGPKAGNPKPSRLNFPI